MHMVILNKYHNLLSYCLSLMVENCAEQPAQPTEQQSLPATLLFIFVVLGLEPNLHKDVASKMV